MYQTPAQLIELNKANVDVAVRIAGVALQGVEKLVDLQMEAAKAALAESANSVRALSAVKDPKDLAALRASLVQPNIEKATAYARSVYGVAAATQSELAKLIETQVSEFNRSFATAIDKSSKSAPAGSEFAVTALKSAVAAANAAYDNLSKVAKQFAQITEANVNSAAQAAAPSRKKAA